MLCAATTVTPEPFAMSPGGLPILPELLPLPEPLEPPLPPVLPLPPELPDPPTPPLWPELPLALPELPLEPAPELPPLPALDPPVLLPLVPVLTPLSLLDPAVAAPDEPVLPSGAPREFDESDDEPHAVAANERAKNATERTDFMVGHYLRGSHASCGGTNDRKVVTRRSHRGSAFFRPRGSGGGRSVDASGSWTVTAS
jgi:hypothetical protein